MADEYKAREDSGVEARPRSKSSKKGAIVLLTLALCCFSFIALASCQPAAKSDDAKADEATEKTEGSGFTTPGQFSNLDSGEWGDTQYAKAVNAGNRGCNACHEDLFDVLPAGENSKGLHEVDAPPAYGRTYTWNDCITCHVHAPGTGSALGGCGPYMASSIHGYHFSNEEFLAKDGNCFSCHEVDVTTGELGMWDELKYTKMIGLGNTAPLQKFETWLGGRGYATSTVTGGMVEENVVLDNVKMTQDTSSPDDLYSATNMDYPDLTEDTYEFTLKGVKNEKTYTLADLRAMPQSEVTFTKMCMTNGANGGWYVANIPAKGVLISDLIEDCGGLLDTSASYAYTGYDGWSGASTPTLSEFPLSYMDPNAMIALEFWGEPIEYMDGGPASFIQPGAPATTMAKWVKELVFLDGSTVNPDRTYTQVAFPGIWAGWFNPARDGQEIKVGETITLEGYAWALPEQGRNKTLSVQFSADYGETWTNFDVPESFDCDQWVRWSADWTPEVAGTYCLTVHCGSELADNPSNDGSILIKVVE